MSYILEAIFNELSNYDIRLIQNIKKHIYTDKLLIIVPKRQMNFILINGQELLYTCESNFNYYEMTSVISLNNVKKKILLMFYNIYTNMQEKTLTNTSENTLNNTLIDTTFDADKKLISLCFNKHYNMINIELINYTCNIDDIVISILRSHNFKSFIYPNLEPVNYNDGYVILFPLQK